MRPRLDHRLPYIAILLLSSFLLVIDEPCSCTGPLVVPVKADQGAVLRRDVGLTSPTEMRPQFTRLRVMRARVFFVAKAPGGYHEDREQLLVDALRCYCAEEPA